VLPLRLEKVCITISGQQIIDGVSAVFEAGPRSIIIGPNGAGKSMLLRLCHGLVSPSSGHVQWSGESGSSSRQAMVFQRPVMLRRSALANVIYALAVASIPRAEREPRARAAMERAGLLSIAERPARVLSGGEQQRLALARAWALNPEVLFLDEPTANLDPGATREVEAVIQAIHEGGAKIIMTTHNLGQARRLGDEILFLNQGRLAEHSDAAAFFPKPRSAEANAFIRGELPWD
jgi:tungstate transport system ATP-binding protein